MSFRATRGISLLFSCALLLSALPSSAQVATGTPPFGSFTGGPDVVNIANLNAHLGISVLHKSGRGISFAYDLNYDSSVWRTVNSGGTTTWQPVNSTFGWTGAAPTGNTFVVYSMAYTSGNCGFHGMSTYQTWTYSNFVYHDEFGVAHTMSVNGGAYTISNDSSCPPNGPQPPTTPWVGPTNDGSGLKLYVTPGPGSIGGYVVAPNGTITYPFIAVSPPASQSFPEQIVMATRLRLIPAVISMTPSVPRHPF